MSLELVKLLFTKKFKIEKELTPETLISDICVDSLEILELLMYIEEKFNISIPDEEAQSFQTLGDISEYLTTCFDETKLKKIYDKIK